MTTKKPPEIKFSQTGIGTILKGKRLAVPLNQREYSWEDKHVLDLFHDLAGTIDGGKSSYFLGTIVLTEEQKGILQVVDGQQRLATTTILLAAIRDYFIDRNDKDGVGDLERFLYTFVRERRETEPLLRLNVDDTEFFHKRILLRKGEQQRKAAKPSKPSHFRIEKAAQLAEQHVQAVIKPHSPANQITQLNRWVDFIEDNALITVLEVPDDVNAYVMFETLNDRGLKTSQADLVKNYLFAQADSRLPEAQQRWAIMTGALETVDEDDVTITYLRHFLISQYGHTREKDVLARVKEKIVGPSQAVEFLGALADRASDYIALLTPTHHKWSNYSPETRKHVRTLREKLQMVPMRPLMLAATTRLPKKQAEIALRLFIFWSVRFLISGGGRSGAVEEGFAELAKEISAGRIATTAKMAEEALKLIPTDSEFRADFANARIRKNDLARYYLRALEFKVQENPIPEAIQDEEIVISLEHVLPENLGENWKDFDKNLHEVYFRRLGNMALLKAGPNSDLGNKSFSEKRKEYEKSGYKLTYDIAKRTVWTPKEIEDRQSVLADLAVATWPILLPTT